MRISRLSSNSEILSEIGIRIKDNRINQGLTQKDLSDKTGLSLKTISNMENGKDFGFDSFLRVLKVLNIVENIEYIINEQKIRPNDTIPYDRKRYRKKDEGNSFVWGEDK